MPSFFSPAAIAKPQSRYSHGVTHPLAGRRLLISGQLGVAPDGTLAEGLEQQMEQAWRNLLAVLAEAGMQASDLVKVTAYCTVRGSAPLHRQVRERMLGAHAPASTYLEVAGLARAEFLYEVEGEAVREP